MDDLMIARLQMASSLGFHIIFAVIGIGMPALMAIADFRYLRTGSAACNALAKHWAKGTAIFFAVGAVSGTVLSFELGLLWPGFMRHAGAIIGFPFSLEGFAFFTEAIFLGIYLYGREKLSPWLHWWTGVIVAASGAASAVFVVMANAWMNTPAGFDYDATTHTFSNIRPIAAMFNPAWKAEVLHMLSAAYLATAAMAAGIHALQLLRRPADAFHREALKITMTVAAIFSVLQPITGDYAAKVVARSQPIKLAAMEGQFDSLSQAPLRIGGFPNERAAETRFAIELPGLLSFLAYGDFNATVRGLNDFPRDQWPPVAVVHFSFQIMVALGMALLAVAAWFSIAAIRRRKLPLNRWLLRAIVAVAPAGFLAIEAGWVVTEVGRQPWIISGVMRTSQAVTPMTGLAVPLITFSLVYLLLATITVALFLHQIRAAHAAEAVG